jgi:hypothetical protein
MDNYDGCEVLQGTLVSRNDIHLARREAIQEKTDTNVKEMKAGQERLKEDIMADLTTHLGCLASCTEVNQEEVEA